MVDGKRRNKMKIEIGKRVVRLASDYTNGRKGEVIEINNEKGRARVAWSEESNGERMKLRTWIRFTDLAPAL